VSDEEPVQLKLGKLELKLAPNFTPDDVRALLGLTSEVLTVGYAVTLLWKCAKVYDPDLEREDVFENHDPDDFPAMGAALMELVARYAAQLKVATNQKFVA
jgi:hypothetical protein